MNIAVINHNKQTTGQRYLFAVPEGVKLKAGDTVMCKTKRGDEFGWLVYDSFDVEGAALDAIITSHGAKLPLQPITGVYELSSFDEEEEHEVESTAAELTVTMNAQITEIVRDAETAEYFLQSKRTAEDFARQIKHLCNVDDVVITDLKVFIHDEQKNV